jgi:Family of unknown function (DUF6328)
MSGVDIDHPEEGQGWDTRARHETESERLDRNWSSLLQELRVAQTGVQLLTGFLLTLPFQQRFDGLSAGMRDVYLATVACSVGSTVLLVAPVGMHRLLFRRHRLKTLVATAHKCAISGLVLLGAALVGVVTVIFNVVGGTTAGWIAATCAALGLLFFWALVPLWQRRADARVNAGGQR